MSQEDRQISQEDPKLDPRGQERSPLSDAELAAWDQEDRAEADRVAAVEEALGAQTKRIVELETGWKQLAERAAAQVAQARELEAELSRLRDVADKARVARRAASAELNRAERRATDAQARVEELEREAGERITGFEDSLTKQRGLVVRFERIAAENEERAAELKTKIAAVEEERELAARGLERSLSNRDQERERFADAQRRLEQELEAARSSSARLQAEISEIAAARNQVTALAERQAAERRALVADLVATQSTLQARSEQLQNILRSRWHRLARSTWSARRRRPPIVALVLALAAVAGVVVGIVAATNLGTAIASVLGGVLLGSTALVYAIVVPALRDKRIPRMAGKGTFARPLDVIETSDAGGEPAPSLEAPKTAPGPAGEEPAQIRLVPLPAPDADVDLQRKRWLSGAGTASLSGLRVAGILDEMSRASFAPECELDTGFSAADWRERLAARPPHMLLVESAWSGNDGGWQYCVGSYGHPRFAGLPQLRELLDWCREQGIPAAFWNKEDPVHFDRFKEAAALFDHVFTSDANRVEDYRLLEGARCQTVEALRFAAQPRLHNPIPLLERRFSEPVFAGTYYRDRHADRKRDLEAILDAARPHGLVIYDRTFGDASDSYGFPERFLPHVRGRLSYEDTVAEYKRHLVFLNVNSVTDSPTMFSRRVFELLACGTAVLSTPSIGMQETFGDLVPVAATEEEASTKLRRLLEDDDYRESLTRRAQHLVLSEHTYRDRLLQIARTVGFAFPDSGGEEVAVLAIVDRPDELDEVSRSLLEQTRGADEVIVGVGEGLDLDGDRAGLEARLDGVPVRTVAQPHDRSRPERLRELAGLAATPWVAPLATSRRYGPDHLLSLIACTRFADADIVGSAGDGAANGYGESVSPECAMGGRDLVARRGWPRDAAEMRRWFSQGIRIYAAEPHEPLDV